MPNKPMKTLTINGETFDIVDEVARQGSGGGGLSPIASELLLTILNEAVYGSDQSDNIALLRNELTNVTIVSISAVLNGSALVGTPYSSLDFTVTATFDDASQAEVTEYTIVTQGNVTSGSNTVTISYEGLTTTVTFTAAVVTTYTITYNLTNVTSSSNVSVVEENDYYNTELTVEQGYTFGSCTVTMGGVDITSTAYSNMEILITEVTGNIVITASASQIVYLDPLLRTSRNYYSVVYGYSDYFETQNFRLNYNGAVYASEYPAANNCTLQWTLTNTSEESVSLNGMCIGSIPTDDSSWKTHGNMYLAYCQPIDNASHSLAAGDTLTGTYSLREGYQLAYCLNSSTLSSFSLQFQGSFVEDTFSDYTKLQASETTAYGSYRRIYFYSDSGTTEIGSYASASWRVLNGNLTAGTYEARYSIYSADPTSLAANGTSMVLGAVQDNTSTASNGAIGKNVNADFNVWYAGTLVVSDSGMTIIGNNPTNSNVTYKLCVKAVSV